MTIFYQRLAPNALGLTGNHLITDKSDDFYDSNYHFI
jgi:hypothetical protein